MQFYPPAKPYIGKYKVVPNNVIERVAGTGIQRDVLKTADPGPITEAAMKDLVDWYNETLHKYPWSIAVACEFVFRFLAIHPFQDRNGRLGRALFALILLQSNDKNLQSIAPYIAIDRHIEKTRTEYYLILRKCSEGEFHQDPKEYQIGFFLRYMAKIIGEAIAGDVDYYLNRYDSYMDLAGAPRKTLTCFKEHPEMRLALKDVLEFSGLARRTAIHALGVLVEKGFLQKRGQGRAVQYQLTF